MAGINVSTLDFDRGVVYLADQGLNLLAVLDCQTLPETIRSPMAQSVDLNDYSRLVVLGNTGSRFWHALQRAGMPRTDPIDTFSLKLTQNFLDNTLDGARSEVVFPSNHIIPLQRIGSLVGWGEVSPLGVGISEQHGLWFAYRSAFLTTAELPLSDWVPNVNPCVACADTPCASACPASAVSIQEPFDVDACFRYRASESSSCVQQCLARQACPVGVRSRYPEAMIRYIYENSMTTVRRYCQRD